MGASGGEVFVDVSDRFHPLEKRDVFQTIEDGRDRDPLVHIPVLDRNFGNVLIVDAND
ncbi:hypothetical protein D9M70_447990 [compost metagenome]